MKKTMILISLLGILFMGCSKNSVSLKSGTWNLVEIEGEKIATEASVTFDSYGKTYFNTGINSFNSHCIINKNKGTIKFEDGPMTKMAGSPEDMEIEQKFILNIQDTASYKIENKTLQFLNSEGKTILKFELNEN